MASPKGRFLNLLGALVLREAQVLAVEAAGPDFRLLRLRGDPGAPFQPGDKIQVVLPSQDVRTLTPVRWSSGGETELLVYQRDADTPAMRWLRDLKPGETLRFVGPQRSLSLAEGRAVVVGDETSIAVAAAYAQARPGQARAVIEVGPDVEVGPALAAVGLEAATVLRRGRDGEGDPGLLDAALHAPADAIGVTGGAGLVQRARDGLRGRGAAGVKVKTYWVQGRAGLD